MKRYFLFAPLIIAVVMLSSGDAVRSQATLGELCYACHDEPTEHNAHATGVKPDFELPAKFKAAADGTLQCTTCHVFPTQEQQDKLSNDGMHEGTKWLVSQGKDSEICGECHGAERDYSGEKGKGYGHPVIDVAADNERAAKVIAAGGTLGTDGLVTCRSCHKAHGGANETMNVLPNKKSELCLACHPDRITDRAENRFNHPIERRARRASKEFKATAFFGDKYRVECITCHKPHRAPSSDSFLAMENGQAQLCIQCHRYKSRLVNGPHGEGQGCKNCHAVHDSPSSRYLWKWEDEGRGKVNRELTFCKHCHSEGESAERLRVARSRSHPMGMRVEDARPGFNVIVSCTTCHSIHRGPREPGGYVSYLKIYDGNGGLCVGCHENKQGIQDTPHDIKGGQTMCRKCHRMHWPVTKDDLWARSLPKIAGANRAERECLGCHRKRGLAENKIPPYWNHPEEVEAMVIDGSKFYTEKGRRAKEGDVARIVCATCHNPHSTGEKFLRPSSQVIEYCAACHDTEGEGRYRKFHTSEMRQTQ